MNLKQAWHDIRVWWGGNVPVRRVGGTPLPHSLRGVADGITWPPPPLFDGEVRDGVRICVRPETPLICSRCNIEAAPMYYLKRCRGLYSLLCFQNGAGCWERDGRILCSYVDGFGAQCQFLAEYEIVSLTQDAKQVTCVGHIPFLMRPGVAGQIVFPLDE